MPMTNQRIQNTLTGAVHFLENGGESSPLENVSEQKEWNAGRLSLIE